MHVTDPAAMDTDAARAAGDERKDQLAEDLFGDDEEMPPAPAAASPSVSDASARDADTDDGAALEYHEDEEAPPAPVVEERTAWINVPQVPLRRTKAALVARLPNFVRYAERAFDAANWDPEQEDDEQRAAGAAYTEISDAAAQATLHTDNTLRWRWRDGVPQSNGRIVRWSDGTQSLQLGGEFFDVTQTAESRAPDAPRSFVYVPYRREGVLQADGEIAGTLALKPNLHSESHRRLANAIKHHRSARVIARSDLFGLDPEKEKERIERHLRDAEKRKARERAKANRDDDYDDDLGLDSRRSARRTRVHDVTEWPDDEPDENDDGFIVDDEGDADGGEDPGSGADDLDAADRRIEERERERRRNLSYESDASQDS